MTNVAESVPDAGDLLWVDFGSPTGREQGGRRPAVVLTTRDFNRRSSILIVCPITRREREWPSVVPLPPTGLLRGYILVDQIRAVDPSVRAFRNAGRVPGETLDMVRGKLAALLGIPVPI